MLGAHPRRRLVWRTRRATIRSCDSTVHLSPPLTAGPKPRWRLQSKGWRDEGDTPAASDQIPSCIRPLYQDDGTEQHYSRPFHSDTTSLYTHHVRQLLLPTKRPIEMASRRPASAERALEHYVHPAAHLEIENASRRTTRADQSRGQRNTRMRPRRRIFHRARRNLRARVPPLRGCR